MKGVGGGYNDWPYYVSPGSNLSAFAAPFSVNPYTSSELSSQFMDSAESAETVPPIRFQSYGYDFFSNPVIELDSSPQFPHLGLPSYSARSNLVEAQPYYASPAIHDHSSNSAAPYTWTSGAPSSDWPTLREANKSPELGFSAQGAVSWDQFPEFNSRGKGKHVGVGSSLSSKETNVVGSVGEKRMNQGNQDKKDAANSEFSHTIEWENYNVPESANNLHDTSGWWGTNKPMPVEFSGTSVMQTLSMSLETHHEAHLKAVADSGNNNLSSNIGSYDKHSRHGDKPSRVDTVSSMSRTGLVTEMTIEDMLADEYVGHKHNDFYNTKVASHMPSPGTAGFFDSGHIRMHLGINEPFSSNKAMISDQNVSRDVVDYVFRERHEFQNPHANMDNLRLRLNAVEDVNLVEKSFDGGDRCNPAEDSPCWKGGSASHFSHFEPSAALPREYVHLKESSFGSVIQEPQYYMLDTENNMKKSGGNSNGNQMHTEIVYPETSSVGSPRKFSVKTKFAPEDCKSGIAVNLGPFQSKPCFDFGLHYLDITKMKENTVPPAMPTDCESESPVKLQLVDLREFVSQSKQALGIGVVDSVCNVNNCSGYGSSHSAEHVPPSPSSGVDTTAIPEKSSGKVSAEKLNVQMLLDTMQNLSELLLYHCLNDACELKERDCNVLKNVIGNLNTCSLKNADQITPAQECLFTQPETFKCVGESREFDQTTSFKRRQLISPQLTNTEPESSKVEFENPLVTEANLHFRSGKPHGKLSDSIFPRVDTEMTKADDMTKDLKRILSENFHDDDDEGAEPQTVLYKNLWLDAEAALCSVYYRARYNQIKIEMNKHSYKEKEMEKQSKSEVVPTSSQIQSSATKVQNYPNPDSSAALKWSVLDATNLEELSRLDFSTDMNKPNAMTPEGKGGQNLNCFIDNYLVPCSDVEAETNDESSVMARYQVLKTRVDQPSIDTTNLEEPLDVADKSSPRGRDNQNQVNLCQGSPIPDKSSTDYEASVLARFHILKSRVEDSSSISSEGNLLDGDGSAGKGMDDTTIVNNVSEGKSLDVHVNPALVHLNSYTSVDESTLKEFHSDSDGFTSDWEHVEKSL